MRFLAAILAPLCGLAACGQKSAQPTAKEIMPPMIFEDEAPVYCDSFPGGTLKGDSLLVLVNKEEGNQLRCDWEPEELASIPAELMMPGREGTLRPSAIEAFGELHEAAKKENIRFGIRSAYRSFETQVAVVQHKLKRHGREHTLRYSAMPGRSQHQLGTAIDISTASIRWKLNQTLEETREGRWLAANAYRFGFALAYPDEEEEVTGYAYEPWHYRYIGEAAARELHSTGLILEEYLRGCDADATLQCPDAVDKRLAVQ